MKEQIRNLIAKAKLEKAIGLLLDYTEQNFDTDNHQSLILLSARYNGNERDNNKGIADNYRGETARIVAAVLNILDEVNFDGQTSKSVQSNYTPPQNIAVALDPIDIQHQLTREHLNVPSEFASLSKLGKDVLTFLKEKTNFTENERLFVRNFQNLQWAFDDFKQRNNEVNAKILIDELKKQQQLILSFLIKAAKETPIERLFQDAKEATYETFIEKYRLYLEKAVTLKKVANDALEVFNNEFKELEVDYNNEVMAEIEIEDFKIKMIRRYGM